LEEGALFLDDLKTELHVLGAVAGERVETDFNELDAFGALRGGLFFNGVNNGADEMDFVHKMSFKSLPPHHASVNARRRMVGGGIILQRVEMNDWFDADLA
jgi:hypothetical protein